jgi:tryptophan halogenase
MEHIRDFIILHYHLNERDEPFWRGCREMDLPDKLAARIAQFRQRGHAWQGEDELFRLDSWTHCMLGQGVVPEQHHILPQAMSDADLQKLFEHIRRPLVQAVARMPSHQDFLNSYCRAPDSVWNLRGRSTVG